MLTEQNSPTSFKVTLKLVFSLSLDTQSSPTEKQSASPAPLLLLNSLPLQTHYQPALFWQHDDIRQRCNRFLPTMHTSLVCSCKPPAFNDTQAALHNSARAQCLSLKVLTDRTKREKHHGVGEKCSFLLLHVDVKLSNW